MENFLSSDSSRTSEGVACAVGSPPFWRSIPLPQRWRLPSWLTLNQATSHLSTSLVVLHLYSKGSSEDQSAAFWMFLSQVSGCFLMFPSTNPCSLEQSRRKRETWRLLVGISDFEVLSSMRSAQNTHISQKCW